MEFIIKKIGKIVSTSESFTAFDGCTLYSVKKVSPLEGKIIRFVGFASHDSFEALSLESKIRVLSKSELEKDELAVIFSEYQIEKV